MPEAQGWLLNVWAAEQLVRRESGWAQSLVQPPAMLELLEPSVMEGLKQFLLLKVQVNLGGV